MDLSAALLGRRTIKDFKPDPVPAELLERALTAGIWAQNHKMTQPWRFTVLGPATHGQLATAFAAAQPGAGRAEAESKIRSKPLIVAVSQKLGGDPVQQREDYAAIACAIQNIQLAAWAEGLGMQWSSGKLIRLPTVYEVLGIDAQAEEIVGFLFFGFPARIPEAAPRKPLAEVTRHLP
jgi:nitroreductase